MISVTEASNATQTSHKRAIGYLIGQSFISRTAGAAELVCLNWWVYAQTQSATHVGMLTLVRLLPLMVAGPVLGSVADKRNPRRLLTGVLMLGAALTFVCAWAMQREAWAAVVGIIGMRSLVMAGEPAIRSAMLARLSGRAALLKAMSSLSLVLSLSLALGPLLAGAVLAVATPAVAVAACAVGYAVAAAMLLGLPAGSEVVGDTEPARERRMWSVAAREMRATPRLGQQMALAIGPMLCIFPYTAMMPVLAGAVFATRPSTGLSILAGAAGAGTVTGAFILRKVRVGAPGRVAVVAALVLSVPALVVAAAASAGWAWLTVGLAGVLGAVGQVYRTSNRTATLLLAPAAHRGLFAGLSQTDRVLIPAGAFALGLLADAGGAPAMFLVMGLGNAALVIPVLVAMWRARGG